VQGPCGAVHCVLGRKMSCFGRGGLVLTAPERHSPSMSITSDGIPETALAWHRAGRGAVLATVVETWGSAPRQAGSQLVVAGDGQMMGSVSGGCVEGAVVVESEAALVDGKPRLLTYGVSDEAAFAVGLACGGTIRVLVEPIGEAFPVEVLEGLVQARADKRAIALVTDLTTFPQARFPGEVISEDWPDEALAALVPDARTAIVTLTHDPKLDDPAIRIALRSKAFYIGCLGSKRTHAKRVERLLAEGFSEAEIARIHAPVGLDIGAKSPAEIAVSILAQITHVLRRG